MILSTATPQLARMALSGARLGIDRVDDAMILLLAARRALIATLAPAKRVLDATVRDADREQQVHERARRLATRLRVPTASADSLIGTLITDACQQQATDARARQTPSEAGNGEARARGQRSALRFLPPPRYWKRPLAMIPAGARDVVAERVLSKALDSSLQGDWLSPIRHRRLGIEISDLGLAWVLEVREDGLHRSRGAAEAVVRGSATDLLLLTSRLEDADTLFFQRRLMLMGDVELGLTVRNLLDRMPWETLPLGMRIALHRAARTLRAARAAHEEA